MRVAHVIVPGDSDHQLAVVRSDEAVLVAPLFAGAPSRLQQLIDGGDDLRRRVEKAATEVAGIPVEGLRFGPAVDAPPVVLAIGLNYAAHSSELGLKTD